MCQMTEIIGLEQLPGNQQGVQEVTDPSQHPFLHFASGFC